MFDNLLDLNFDDTVDRCLSKLIESIEIEINIEKVEGELKITSQE